MKKLKDEAGDAFVIALLVVVIVVVVVLAAWIVKRNRDNKTALVTNTAQTSTTASKPPTTLPNGTDNASLDNDLNTVGTSINQGNQDLTNSNNALNDQQQEISVPTY